MARALVVQRGIRVATLAQQQHHAAWVPVAVLQNVASLCIAGICVASQCQHLGSKFHTVSMPAVHCIEQRLVQVIRVNVGLPQVAEHLFLFLFVWMVFCNGAGLQQIPNCIICRHAGGGQLVRAGVV